MLNLDWNGITFCAWCGLKKDINSAGVAVWPEPWLYVAKAYVTRESEEWNNGTSAICPECLNREKYGTGEWKEIKPRGNKTMFETAFRWTLAIVLAVVAYTWFLTSVLLPYFKGWYQ